jgi:hypothetical protein
MRQTLIAATVALATCASASAEPLKVGDELFRFDPPLTACNHFEDAGNALYRRKQFGIEAEMAYARQIDGTYAVDGPRQCSVLKGQDDLYDIRVRQKRKDQNDPSFAWVCLVIRYLTPPIPDGDSLPCFWAHMLDTEASNRGYQIKHFDPKTGKFFGN